MDNKHIKFTPELRKKLQDYADEKFQGNFSVAVRFLCVTGLGRSKSKSKQKS